MFEYLKDLQHRTQHLRIYLEQENPDLKATMDEIKTLEQEFRSIPKTDAAKLTDAETLERGHLITQIVFDQIKIDYLYQLHDGTIQDSFNEFFYQRLSEFIAFANESLDG